MKTDNVHTSNMEFHLEDRYFVIKRKDLSKYLIDLGNSEGVSISERVTTESYLAMENLRLRSNAGRLNSTDDRLRCIVIEDHWPIYPEVYRMLKDWVEFDPGNFSPMCPELRVGISMENFFDHVTTLQKPGSEIAKTANRWDFDCLFSRLQQIVYESHWLDYHKRLAIYNTPSSTITHPSNVITSFTDVEVGVILERTSPELFNILHHTVGIVGEVGELAESILGTFKKLATSETTELDMENLQEELGDILFFFGGLVEALNLKMPDIQRANFRKLKHRYPEGYNDTAAHQRADKQEKAQNDNSQSNSNEENYSFAGQPPKVGFLESKFPEDNYDAPDGKD